MKTTHPVCGAGLSKPGHGGCRPVMHLGAIPQQPHFVARRELHPGGEHDHANRLMSTPRTIQARTPTEPLLKPAT
jgi:hypothetical protein